jgi:peptidoglycan/LPS O-acetylase OafA/YrhL
LYFFEKAGMALGTPFLAKFVWSTENPFPVSFCGALLQGSFFTFFRGDSFYNSSLWTMQPELIGSFVAFGMAPLFWEARKISILSVLFLTGCLILLTHFLRSELVAFPIGVAMAALLPRNKQFSVNIITVGLLLLALYLLGSSCKRIGIYTPLNWIDPTQKLVTYFYILGAAIIIGLVEVVPPWHKFLSGSFWKLLGEFSFPIYLIHVVVICSLGCLAYLYYGRVAAIVVSLVVTPFAALPLLFFNRFWVTRLNRMTNKLLNKTSSLYSS